MNNGIRETLPIETQAVPATSSTPTVLKNELFRLKRELLQAEVRLAKARASAAGAEVDIKVLNTQLKSLTK